MVEKVKSKLLAGFLTGLKIIGKALLLLPIPVAMAWINYTVDVSGVFHGEQFEMDIALAMIGGQAVDNYDKIDERGVLAQMAQNIETPFETLSFGSSRVLQMRDWIANDGRYFNCGVSGGDFVDMLGLYYQFDKMDQKPGTVILELDPWILSRRSYNRHELSDENLYNEFLSERLGKPVAYQPAANEWEKYKALLSPTYLQGNLKSYAAGGKEYIPPAIVTGDVENQDGNIKLSDGSVLYTPAFRATTPQEAQQRAMNDAVGFFWMDEFTQLDEELCGLFDEYVQYLQSQQINVIFLLTPYHPVVYTNATEYPQKYAGFFATEPFFTRYALECDIPLYGSYNPFITGTLGEDFFDGLHMKGEILPEFFPGVTEALRQQETGGAYSPWLTGRVPVELPIAQRLVAERYEISSEHELVREVNETINGVPLYVFGRYEKAGQKAPDEKERVCLARYAVTQTDGIIYRFDTELNVWVVDRRALMG